MHARPVSRVLSRLEPLYPTRSGVIRCSDGHSSRSAVARALKQPTRGFDASPNTECPVGEVGHLSPPIWPCSDRGLPSHACCQACGGLLPHLFTLTSGLRRRRFVFCGTVRREVRRPRAQELPGGLPSGARTFLEGCPKAPIATVRPIMQPPPIYRDRQAGPSGRMSSEHQQRHTDSCSEQKRWQTAGSPPCRHTS